MKIKKIIPILIAIAFISIGIGLFSLAYNDSFHFTNIFRNNISNQADEALKFGKNGIQIRDGSDFVSIGLNGIKVIDGNDKVSIGWDGIKINDANNNIDIGLSGIKVDDNKFNFKNFNFFGISSKNLKWNSVDETKFINANNTDSINIYSSFTDIKVTSEDREDIRIHYYGKMKSNIDIPVLKVDESPNLNIELKVNSKSHTIVESDVVLEVFVPLSFNKDINISTSSGDINMKNLTFNNLEIQSSSGDLELENLEGKVIDTSTSSGDIELEKSKALFNIKSSSGDVSIENREVSEDMNIQTSSGDISLKLSQDSSYNIDAYTSSGDYSFSNNINIKENYKGVLKAIMGSGDKLINIKTSSGDVNFK